MKDLPALEYRESDLPGLAPVIVQQAAPHAVVAVMQAAESGELAADELRILGHTMAAAPELLSALVDLVNLVHELRHRGALDTARLGDENPEDWVREARRIIRKADVRAIAARPEGAASSPAPHDQAPPAPVLGLGVPIGVNDCHGRPIRIGDVLRFDSAEWGGPMEFTVRLVNGRIEHPGATEDLTNWCEIIQPAEADLVTVALSLVARAALDAIRRSFEDDAAALRRILETLCASAPDFDHFYGDPRDGRGPSGE